MAVLSHDGTLLRTMACPISADRRYRLRGARRAKPLPPAPGRPITRHKANATDKRSQARTALQGR